LVGVLEYSSSFRFIIMRRVRVYLDNCCFNRPFDDQSQIRVFLETQAKIHIQKLIAGGTLELAYSHVSVFENSANSNKDHRGVISDFFVYATVYIDSGQEEVIDKMIEKIKIQGVKNKDAAHLACAIKAECDYFITTDDFVLKRFSGKEIKVCSPIEFLTIYEVENA